MRLQILLNINLLFFCSWVDLSILGQNVDNNVFHYWKIGFCWFWKIENIIWILIVCLCLSGWSQSNMLERKVWADLGYVLFGFLTCLLLLQTFYLPKIVIIRPEKHVYILHKQPTNYTNQIHLLPEHDYDRLINLTFNFTILNHVCNESSPLLLVLVHTSPKNLAKRRTIRETWGQNDEQVKVLFLIGSVTSDTLQLALEDENRLYSDIVQGDFLDTYRNMTYKHVMAFKYSIYHCPQARYVLKTDDDVFVNMPTMKNFLTYDLSPYGASRVLCCTPKRNSMVLRTYRSKWRVSFEEFADRNYPTYCPGWALLYSPDVVFALYREAQKSEYFWIDDVHITGTFIDQSVCFFSYSCFLQT